MRIVIAAAAASAILLIAGCSSSDADDPSLEASASARAEQLEESPDAPAPPLSSEEAEADLSELMPEDEQMELTLDLILVEVWYRDDVTDQMRAEACAAGVDGITDEFLSGLAEAEPELAMNDAARAHVHEWFTTECAMIEDLQQ